MIGGVFLGVSNHRHTEAANSRLAAIIDLSADAIVGKTLDGVITDSNSGAQLIFGYEAGKMLGKTISLLTPEGETDEAMGICLHSS